MYRLCSFHVSEVADVKIVCTSIRKEELEIMLDKDPFTATDFLLSRGYLEKFPQLVMRVPKEVSTE